MNSEEWVTHLTELRKRLIWVMLFFIVTLAAGLYVSPRVLMYIKNRPAAAEIEWNVFSLTDGMFIYMKCGFLVAVFFTVPLALYHIWAFVRPGLTNDEAKKTFWFVPLAFVLFMIGIAFSFYVAFPMMVSFLSKMNQTVGAVETYGMDRYFSLMFSLVFPLALAFEMPAVVLFLTRLGILGPSQLKKARKYVYLALAVIGSMISPPDFVSHLSVTIPLILLFELSILVSRWYLDRKETEHPLLDPKGGANHV
ncbi:twin-arginine translocase subunit TatC [Paenibacillus sp. JTLBN-2024]|jgi:sec-independent protein translocase protein TatC|uniref:Sec-independent protein translocase protein TatC n=1 Tax=Paenibacillus cookii TaxID=157839 RepID=A0ABQ4LR23_9BACL|nr:twin-arginine translocase subunit TatC [Paenibacillus cookii]GIO65687.1 Sec-independent protein translocase protein TatCy [Paenibacillus cookii]HWO53189.1 twin-arginine translocase subunit TatC [Paenibacillus cookii]